MKSLAATILGQRTETEQFFLEALQEVVCCLLLLSVCYVRLLSFFFVRCLCAWPIIASILCTVLINIAFLPLSSHFLLFSPSICFISSGEGGDPQRASSQPAGDPPGVKQTQERGRSTGSHCWTHHQPWYEMLVFCFFLMLL